MKKQPKRRVKWFGRKRGSKAYRYAWIGYSTRNAKGTPTFEREVNITDLPPEVIAMVERGLAGGDEEVVPASSVQFLDSLPMGDVWTVLGLCGDLGILAALDEELSPPWRDAVVAMIADRVVNAKPRSKRALCDSYPESPLRDMVQGDPIPLPAWYHSLGGLYRAQERIETRLAEGAIDGVFLYDITSSYFEGECCPLAEYGYNRDGKKGKKQIVIGLLANSEGRPLALRVYDGNTRDDTTVIGWLDRLRDQFGAEQLVFVGDRGMATSSIRREIDESDRDRIEYITALTRKEIMERLEDDAHPLQLGLFDRRGLAEIEHEGQRYVLCFNPDKESEDRLARRRLMDKTEEKLLMVERNVAAGHWKSEKTIAAHHLRWLNRWKVGRFFKVEYGPGSFSFRREEEEIARWERLDGCYVILSTVPRESLGTEAVRGHYGTLAQVEQAFRTMKTTDEFIRPIRHWSPDNVRGHVFMCMLAYLVIWEARKRFAGLLERDAARQCEGDSLREIWEALAEGVKVGMLRIGDDEIRQLAPVADYPRRLLEAAGHPIRAAEKRRLRVA